MGTAPPPDGMNAGGAGDAADERARGEIYALLAALLAAAPRAELYERLRAAPVDVPVEASAASGSLATSFAALVAASQRLDLGAVRAEFDTLFQGIAKAEVMPYASHYLAGALNEAPLVALRDDLRAIGLEGDPALGVTEDHIACLCEVMQHLIAGGDLQVQRRFFAVHLQPWVGALWDELATHPRSGFYRAVACFARDFFGVEALAFEMLEPPAC